MLPGLTAAAIPARMPQVLPPTRKKARSEPQSPAARSMASRRTLWASWRLSKPSISVMSRAQGSSVPGPAPLCPGMCMEHAPDRA